MQPRRTNRTALVVSATVFLVVAAIGLHQLYRSQPSEDAFILFKYAENLAHDASITYTPGTPPTEGATDFLWLVLLASSVRAGADVALAALGWNALGAALCAWLLARDESLEDVPPAWRWAPLAVPLSIPLLAGAPAAYLGFSTLAYQGLVLLTFTVATVARGEALAVVPWLGLALTLFRPDGAFLAAGFSVAGLARARRQAEAAPFLRAAAGAVLVGAGYFAWRWRYFGLPLPLPLYVKSHGVVHGPLADVILRHLPWLSGLAVGLMWLKSALGPLSMAAALAALWALAGGRSTARWRARAATAALAGALFLGALSCVFQVQNVHFRYQAPATLLVAALLLGIAAERLAEARSTVARVAVTAVLLLGLAPALGGGAAAVAATAGGRSYIDVLPAGLGGVLSPGRTIALTDAGRLGYWSRGRVIDVAGLNDARTALRPATVAWLRSIDPDVLLIHPGAAVVGESFAPDRGAPAFFEIDAGRIERAIAPDLRTIYEHGLDGYGPETNVATVAAVVMLRYLAERAGDYVIVAVRYQAGYRHVLAYRRALPEAAAIRAALAAATSGRGYRSYAALKGFPFAHPVDAEVDGVAY